MSTRALPALLLAIGLYLAAGTASPEDRARPQPPSRQASLSASWTPAQRAVIQSLGPWPPGVHSDSPPLQSRLNPLSGHTEAIELGKKLFSDLALSGNGRLSCATCHQPSKAFTDGQTSATGTLQGHRNTPSLFDLSDQRWFGWDGGADSLWAASLRPLLDPSEMASSAARVSEVTSANPQYRALLHSLQQRMRAQGGAWKTASNEEQQLVLSAMSMAAWMEGLTSPPAAFDRYRDALKLGNTAEQSKALGESGFTSAAERGLATFIGKGNCIVCHGGPRFTHGEFHDIGIAFLLKDAKATGPRDTSAGVDPGRYRGIERVRKDPYNLSSTWSPARGGAEAALIRQTVLQHRNWGEWKIPSLRNLRQTAPYMHNGSLANLHEVVGHYSQLNEERLHTDGEALLKPLRLSAQEVEDLAAFLESLSPQ